MDQTAVTKVFECLSSSLRLDIYRLLVRHGRTGLVSGEIAEALKLPPTNTSFHLKTLTQSNLISVEQEGRYQRYKVNLSIMTDIINYLTEECCLGEPEKCITVTCPSNFASEDN